MLENIKGAFFDLDGTLVDSMWVWGNIDYEFLKRRGLSVPEDLHIAIEGSSMTEVAEFFKKRFELSDSIDEMIDEWNQMAFYKYQNEVKGKKGIKAFLEKLKGKGVKLAVCTSNSLVLCKETLNSNNILSYFDVIISSDDNLKGKPEPDVYLAAMNKLNLRPEECLVFEDLCKGIQAGKNAGIKTIAVKDEYSMYQWEEKKQLADFFIEDYCEII